MGLTRPQRRVQCGHTRNQEYHLLPDSIEKLHLEHVKRSLTLGDQAGLIAFTAMGHAMHLGHAMRTASGSSAARFAI